MEFLEHKEASLNMLLGPVITPVKLVGFNQHIYTIVIQDSNLLL